LWFIKHVNQISVSESIAAVDASIAAEVEALDVAILAPAQPAPAEAVSQPAHSEHQPKPSFPPPAGVPTQEGPDGLRFDSG
jgi:hypothetical protein